MKRGQITIYMIFGVMLLIIIGFTMMLSSYTKQAPATQDLPTSFKQYVETCLAKTTADGLYRMGQYSADMDLQPRFLQNPFFNTNYALINGINQLIALEPDAKIKLEKYISENVEKCIDFSLFEGQGMKFTLNSNSDATVAFGKTDVLSIWNKKIVLSVGNGPSVQFDSFQTKLYLPFRYTYDKTTEFIELINEEGEYDLTLLRKFDGNAVGTVFEDGAMVVYQPLEVREKQPYLFIYGFD